jgi:high affinity sulfate transporter 1
MNLRHRRHEGTDEVSASRLPIRAWARRYRREWLRGDLTAGLIIAALAVPQALGYAGIAGVPVEVGLYAVPTALLAYAVFGSSPQLIVGPVSTVSILSGSLVASMNPADEGEAVSYTIALAFGAGVVLIAAGMLKVGWVAEFLSRPIVTGFVFGLTIIVIVGELPKMFGVSVPSGNVFVRVAGLFSTIGTMNGLTIVIAAVSLVVLFGLGGRWPKVPWALVLVVVSIALSTLLDWADQGVAVVGTVPSGFPLPSLPGIPLAELGTVLVYGASLALVGLAEGLSAARLFAVKGGYRVEADQELVAAGAANVASGLFGGLGVAGSLSKTAAAAGAGARSQVAGITTAVSALVVIVALAPLLSALPLAVLSAVVVKAVWGLMDVAAMRRYREVRQLDLNAAIIALLGVLLFGPLPGLSIAIGMSVLGLVYRASIVHVEEMGRIRGEKAAWGSMANHPERRTIPGIVVVRIDVPVFWVNATRCYDGVLAAVVAAEQEDEEKVRAVVIDLEGTNALDTTSADTVGALVSALNEQGVDVYFARVRFQVRQLLRRAGVMTLIGEDHVWHSISQAVRQARSDHLITTEPRSMAEQEGRVPNVPPSGEDAFGHRWSPFDP